ncbi:shootin-1-like [Saccoglossus kowalevskii]
MACNGDTVNHINVVTNQTRKTSQKIKRQSQAIFMKAGLNIEDFNMSLDDGNDEESVDIKEFEELKRTLEDLRKQLIESKQELVAVKTQRDEAKDTVLFFKTEVANINTKYESECRDHMVTKEKLDEHEKTIEQFTRVNTMVYQELEQLKEDHEKERTLRQKAEHYAAEKEQESTAMKRQSSILLLSVDNEDRLRESLETVEQLTAELEKVKQECNEKVRDLEEQLHTSVDVKNMESLQEKMNIAAEENELLEERANKSEERVRALETQVKKLETDLEKALLKPIPPPPPPPPPPPSSVNPLSALRSALRSKNNKQHIIQEQTKNDNSKAMNQAMKEMMARIHSGKALRSVKQTGTTSPDNDMQGMKELGSILGNLKRKKMVNETCGKSLSNTSTEQSELLLIMARRRRKTDGDISLSDLPTCVKPLPKKPPRKSINSTSSSKSSLSSMTSDLSLSLKDTDSVNDDVYDEAMSTQEEKKIENGTREEKKKDVCDESEDAVYECAVGDDRSDDEMYTTLDSP